MSAGYYFRDSNMESIIYCSLRSDQNQPLRKLLQQVRRQYLPEQISLELSLRLHFRRTEYGLQLLLHHHRFQRYIYESPHKLPEPALS